MLTFVNQQVNSIAMVVAPTSHQPVQSAQQTLAAQMLQPLLARRRPGRILVLKHAAAGDLPLQTVNAAQVVRLSSNELAGEALLRCRLTALPFAESVFDLVILHHLVCDGSDPFLAGVLRITAEGGDIVISGLNSTGLRHRISNRKQRLPALKLDRICHYLRSQSFDIENCLTMGLAGLSRPALRVSWFGMGLPFADRVVLHAHHQSNIKNASVLRFKQAQAVGLSSAALDGCRSREAAS
jgi:SAM-dependent methyltransferase